MSELDEKRAVGMADAPGGRRNRPTQPLVPLLTFAVELAGRHFEAGQKLDIALIAFLASVSSFLQAASPEPMPTLATSALQFRATSKSGIPSAA